MAWVFTVIGLMNVAIAWYTDSTFLLLVALAAFVTASVVDYVQHH